MKLKTHLVNEAIILPDLNTVKQIKTALFMIHDQWLKMARVNTGQKLHKFINKELQSKGLNVIVQFKSDSSVANTVQGEAGIGNIMLVHNPDYTFHAWEHEFQSWLKALTRTLEHELVHVEQIKRIKAANTDELFKILDGISAKFADYDKRKAEWVIKDWDKYLSSGTEIMAHAQSAASAVLQGTDNPYLRRKGVTVPSPSKIIEMAKSKSGIGTLANLSRHFNGYYKLRHYMPKVWKKFIRYFVDYIQSHGEGLTEEQQLINELFDKAPVIDIDWWIASDNATTTLPEKEASIIVKFSKYGTKAYNADFSTKDKGNATVMEMFYAAMLTIAEFIKKKKPDEMAFYASDKLRAKIYKKLIGKFLDLSKWDSKEAEGLPFMRGVPAYYIKKKNKKEFEIEKYE
jgi:hypothetical protein